MKRENKQLLIDSLNNELSNLYHNATLKWADDISGFTSFFDYTMQQAEYDVDWLNGGGACGLKPYNEMQHIKEKAAKYKTEAAQRYFLKLKRKEYYAESSAYITDYIVREYGAVYSYGRGGRTLAPESWVNSNGRGFNPKQYEAADISAEKAALMLRDVKRFNKWVHEWCKYAPKQYQEAARDFFSENIAENKSALHDTNKKALNLICEIKAANKSFSAEICGVLTNTLKGYVSERREYLTELSFNQRQYAALK